MNWFQGAQQPNSSTGAAMQPVFNPWAQQAAQGAYSPQMVQGARGDLLAQLGMGLMAAGQPMSGAQRAQYLAQLGQAPMQYQQDLAQRLKAQQEAQLYQQQQAFRDIIQKASPEQLDALGIPRGAADIFKSLPDPSGVIEKKLTAGPGDPNTQVVEVNGRKMLMDQRTGDTIKDLGPVTPAAPKSPELVTLVPPQGSPGQPQTLNVNDPSNYAQADQLMRQGWTRQQGGTTINMPKPATEAQQRIGNLYGNIYQSNRELSQNESALTNAWDAFLQRGGAIGNLAQSSEYQQAIRSQTDFVQQLAYVRSGANLAPAEAERLANSYFARPGDKPEVIAAKKKARNIALLSLKAAMGEQRPMLDQIEREIEQQDNPDLGAP